MQAPNTLGLFVAGIILPLAIAVGPNGPTQPGAPADCIAWYSAEEGDTVMSISRKFNIPLETFMHANPQLSGNPLVLWKGYDYCVPQGSKTPPTQDSSKASSGSDAGSSGGASINPEEIGYSSQGYGPTFQGATGTGGPMQPANGTGYFPVYSLATDEGIPNAPATGSSEEATKPASATGALADGPTAADKSDEHESRSNEKGSSIKESSTTSEGSTTGSQATAASQPAKSSETTSAAQLTTNAQSSTSAQSSIGSQSAADSHLDSSAGSHSSASSESSAGSQLKTDSQTTADSRSSPSSQSTAASPGSGSNSGGSTMIISILAPTQSQSGTKAETTNSSDKGANDLAPSFGAVRRDL